MMGEEADGIKVKASSVEFGGFDSFAKEETQSVRNEQQQYQVNRLDVFDAV